MPSTTTGGTPIPTLGDEPNVPGDFDTTISFLDARVRHRYASSGARNAGIPSPVEGQECVLNGMPQEYRTGDWVDSRPSPITYNAGSWGVQAGLNNTGPITWAPTIYTITPTRTGRARVFIDLDAEHGSTGFVGAFFNVRLNSSVIDSGTFLMEGTAWWRNRQRFAVRRPVQFVKNVAVTLDLQVWSFSNAGTWKLNQGQWQVVEG